MSVDTSLTDPERTTPSSLTIVDWARSVVGDDVTTLTVPHGERPTQVHGANATGEALVTNGALGADVIRLPAGAGFLPHTHPGHHILIVVAGEGTITYGGYVHQTRAGQVYLVEGAVPHAVGAITDHVIVAVGSPHKEIDAEDRMAPVPYTEVIAPDGNLTCLICNISTVDPERLHDTDCSHCPCKTCATQGRS